VHSGVSHCSLSGHVSKAETFNTQPAKEEHSNGQKHTVTNPLKTHTGNSTAKFKFSQSKLAKYIFDKFHKVQNCAELSQNVVTCLASNRKVKSTIAAGMHRNSLNRQTNILLLVHLSREALYPT